MRPSAKPVDSALTGDRKTYQMDSANRTEAILETELDIQEGADMVMVKPAMSYLDILRDVAEHLPGTGCRLSNLRGIRDDRGRCSQRVRIEQANRPCWSRLTAIRRAGAQNILTYYATEAARLLA